MSSAVEEVEIVFISGRGCGGGGVGSGCTGSLYAERFSFSFSCFLWAIYFVTGPCESFDFSFEFLNSFTCYEPRESLFVIKGDEVLFVCIECAIVKCFFHSWAASLRS